MPLAEQRATKLGRPGGLKVEPAIHSSRKQEFLGDHSNLPREQR